MRAAFILTPDFRLVSSLVPKLTGDVFTVGSVALMVKSFDTPYGRITAGTKGFVDFIDQETGAVWILMEGMEPALVMWNNRLVLMPFDTDDLTECFAFVPGNLFMLQRTQVDVCGTSRDQCVSSSSRLSQDN